MQIVCSVTDSFVYSGMVPSPGAAPCNPPSEGGERRKEREEGVRKWQRNGGNERQRSEKTEAHTGGHCDTEKNDIRMSVRRVHFSLQAGRIGTRGHNNKVSGEQRRDRDRKDAFSTFPCF